MKTGFTLIGILTGMLIFTIVMGIIAGLFVSAIQTQARGMASQELLSQISFSMEYMSRALRMAQKEAASSNGCLIKGEGYNYENPNGVTSSVRFINDDGECQQFFLDGTQLKEKKSTDKTAANFGPDRALTSSNIKVEALEFKLSGEGEEDALQPRVTIVLRVKGRAVVKNPPELRIQTTVSKRKPDFKVE